MTDAAYDELRNSYIKQYGSGDLDYTPGKVSESFVPFHHPIPITSLAKIKMGTEDSDAELTKWCKRLSPIVLEPKYDGLTVVAYLQEDGHYKFVTRGSGTDGEILPNFISRYEGDMLARGTYAIRGEVMLTKKAFAEIQADQKLKGEKPFKNIRNAAAGILRSKERSPYIDKLVYICYDIIGWDVSELRKLAYIAEETPFMATKCSDTFTADTPNEYIWKACNEILENVGAELPLDGVVIKTQRDGSLAELGSTGHHPNNAVACKPEKAVYETTLRDIEFSIGRTKITPVAIFDPIVIDDTEVTRASIHNKDYFDKLALCIGDTVFVYKSNEIIPQIDSVVHNGGKRFEWPSADTNRTDIIIREMMHMASKPVLDIKGFSEQTSRKFLDYFEMDAQEIGQNILLNIAEPFEIAEMEGFGEKSAQKLFDQIQKIRQDGVPFPRFVRAMCVPGIGAHIGEALESRFRTQEEFEKYVIEMDGCHNREECLARAKELTEIDGIGESTSIVLVGETFRNAYKALSQFTHPVWDTTAQAVPDGASLSAIAGKHFVLTGKMAKPRSEYESEIKLKMGLVQSSVNSKTDFLVIADVNSTSSKAKKARELGTQLISPEELEQMLNA